MAIVYVVGAGASYGEEFSAVEPRFPHSKVSPPITTGFFSQELLLALKQDIDVIKEEFRELFNWTMLSCLSTQERCFGEGEWKSLNIEDVFTRLEICREFESPMGRTGAALLVIRNQLLDYIRRIIGLCTRNARGRYYQTLIGNLRHDDSLITFNWDLLLDQCFFGTSNTLPHYNNFLERIDESDGSEFIFRLHPGGGLFLKLHGSLNWFQCTNRICSSAGKVIVQRDTKFCLACSLGTDRFTCRRCGSDSAPLIIPPVLRKTITQEETVRAAWGLAKAMLQRANVVVVIGFSAAPTDFYASWLLNTAVEDPMRLRETLLSRKSVIVANPLNDRAELGAEDFERRMRKLFPHGYDARFKRFSEIEQICELAKDLSGPIEPNLPTEAPT